MKASSRTVYDALVDSTALATWLPPGNMTGHFERFDARPGGSYRMVLSYPDAATGQGKSTDDSDVVEARFVDLIEGIRVVQEVSFDSDDPAFSGTMTIRWDIESADEGAHVQITAENVPERISAKDHIAGMNSSLDQLARYLET